MSKPTYRAGDWVRVLRNDVGGASPYKEGTTLAAFEAIQVLKVEHDLLYYKCGRSACYVPVKDTERIEGCVCAVPVLNTLGCKCGDATMKKVISGGG